MSQFTDMRASFDTHDVFNQSPVFGDVNLFTSDPILSRMVAAHGAKWATNELSSLGEEAGSEEMLEAARQANTHTPVLKSFDAKGRRQDTVEFHPAYHRFMALSMRHGLHSAVWEHLVEGGNGSAPRAGIHVARGAGVYMMAEAEPGHGCPITMTHAATAALLKSPEVAKQWLPKMLSRQYDPRFLPAGEKSAVTVGMGMTEKQGGTDVRANTTSAEPLGGSDGEHLLTGHKWFMSAPMCDAFLMLAQSGGGLSCFLVPRFRADGSVNGLRFQRLKDKVGNRSNASSEVELYAASGWLVGEEGRGVPTIIEMVTLTRLDCALASAGLARFALANAVHHVRHRSVFQKRLVDQPLMSAVLADMALDVEAMAALAFRLARSFDAGPEDEHELAYARVMTPVTKYLNCKAVPAIANEAMECLGGNGYVEDGPLGRVYREAPLNAIWEGSGNVMCLDLLRVVSRDVDAFEMVYTDLVEAAGADADILAALEQARDILFDPARAEPQARHACEQLAMAAAAIELRRHASAERADAYVAARLRGGTRYTYGAGDLAGGMLDTRRAVDELLPDV